MAEILITVFLLLCAENAVFTLLFRDNAFMSLDVPKGKPLMFSALTAAFTAVPLLLSYALSNEGLVLPLAVSFVAASLLALYMFFLKKAENKLYYFAVALNSAVAVILSYNVELNAFPSPAVVAVANGVAVFFASICFAGVKENFYRRTRGIAMTCVYAASLILIAIVAFVGLVF